MAITHNAVVAVADDGTSPVGSDEWNAAHTIEAGTIEADMLAAGVAVSGPTGDTGATGAQGPVGPFLTGAEIQWPVATPPTGWLIEDGSSQLIASYPDLSALIRSTYGGADATHFYVPDMRGVVPVGYKAGDANFGTLGGTGGEKTHLLTAAESGVPAHTHTNGVVGGGSVAGYGFAVQGPLTNIGNQAGYTQVNAAAAASAAHNNLQPYRVRVFVIKT